MLIFILCLGVGSVWQLTVLLKFQVDILPPFSRGVGWACAHSVNYLDPQEGGTRFWSEPMATMDEHLLKTVLFIGPVVILFLFWIK